MPKLLGASVRMLVRDRQGLFWALAFPLIFTVVFSLFDVDAGPQADLVVVGDEGQVTVALRQGLGHVDGFTLEEDVVDPAAARAALERGEVDAVLQVQDGGGGSGAVTVLYDEAAVSTNQVVLPVIRQIVDGLNLRLAGVDPPVTVTTRGVAARDVGYYDWALPGFVGMGIMTFAILGVATAMTQWRQQRIFRRVLATPLPPSRFVAAQLVARLGLTAVQVAIILAVGLALGARVYGSLPLLLLVGVLGNVIFLNLGFAVAGRAATVESASGLGNAVALPMMFLSGVFFPIDTLPGLLQAVVRWLPLTPLVDALRAIALEAQGLTDLGPELALLAGWVVASFLLARRLFSFADVRA